MGDPRKKIVSPIDVLTSARDKLDAGWCRKDFARDHEGHRVDPVKKAAAYFDIEGAIVHAAHWSARPPHRPEVAWRLERQLVDLLASLVCKPGEIDEIGSSYVLEKYNDAKRRKKSEILKLFDVAIELIGAEILAEQTRLENGQEPEA